MDNDILINQARQLYAALCCLQQVPSERIEHMLLIAYCRYQRRLNRCVICYQSRDYDCIRLPGEKHIPCQHYKPHNGTDVSIIHVRSSPPLAVG